MGHDPRRLLALTGLDEATLGDPDAWVPMRVVLSLRTRAVDTTGDADLSLHLAERLAGWEPGVAGLAERQARHTGRCSISFDMNWRPVTWPTIACRLRRSHSSSVFKNSVPSIAPSNAGDGQRCLYVARQDEAIPRTIHLVLNWPALLNGPARRARASD